MIPSRRDRDSLKLDKNEQFLQHQKEIEELKNKNRDLQSEIDRMDFKVVVTAFSCGFDFF